MPIFEYQCENCGSKFEKLLRRAADAAAISCPDCGGAQLNQQYSTFSAHANGKTQAAEMPSCPGGMCSNPGLCGRN